jgi:deoxyribonuclease IV
MSFRLGFHASSAGTLEKTAEFVAGMGGNTFQIFSSSPRMWHAPPPDKTQALLLERARAKLDLFPLVIHANYLINLCSADAGIRAKSISAFRGEIERALVIGAEYLVVHPGSSKDQTVAEAIELGAKGLIEAAQGKSSERLHILLENTAGQGAAVGCNLEELALLRQLSHEQVGLPVGFCLDTCHLFAAGFPIHQPEGLASTLAHVEQYLGLENVPVIHTNDSKPALGSHVDRHDNIGKGQIGLEAFERIINEPRLRDKAFVLETPSEEDGHAKDMAALRGLRKP